MDVTAESVAEVHDRRQQARRLKMIYEPKYLRFFQARFKRKAREHPVTRSGNFANVSLHGRRCVPKMSL